MIDIFFWAFKYRRSRICSSFFCGRIYRRRKVAAITIGTEIFELLFKIGLPQSVWPERKEKAWESESCYLRMRMKVLWRIQLTILVRCWVLLLFSLAVAGTEPLVLSMLILKNSTWVVQEGKNVWRWNSRKSLWEKMLGSNRFPPWARQMSVYFYDARFMHFSVDELRRGFSFRY